MEKKIKENKPSVHLSKKPLFYITCIVLIAIVGVLVYVNTSYLYMEANGAKDYVAGTPSHLRTYEVSAQYGQNKLQITNAADKMYATKAEKAIILAVANLETNSMTIDEVEAFNQKYQKTGDTQLFSIFKMNRIQIITNSGYTDDLNKLNTDLSQATKVILTNIRKQGVDKFFKQHNGGESGLNGTINTSEYRNTIKEIAREYFNNDVLMSNNERVDKVLAPIEEKIPSSMW